MLIKLQIFKEASLHVKNMVVFKSWNCNLYANFGGFSSQLIKELYEKAWITELTKECLCISKQGASKDDGKVPWGCSCQKLCPMAGQLAYDIEPHSEEETHPFDAWTD